MVKTSDELGLMRVSGRLLASVFEMLDAQDFDGISTLQITDLVDSFITADLDARPASKGQYGFKYVLNCSINHVVCDGVPDPDEIVRDGNIINLDITLEKDGCSVLREYFGHGIGHEMHEEPQVLNFGRPRTGMKLRECMVFTIEPMVNEGSCMVATESDRWTVVTKDRKLSAQFEHTVAVTRNGVEVLTLRRDEALLER
ncbi:MAG: type I methionyl aminopeptidase [Alphaproteobacteria bacterium]